MSGPQFEPHKTYPGEEDFSSPPAAGKPSVSPPVSPPVSEEPPPVSEEPPLLPETEEGEPQEPETIEVEIGGVKYTVPKAIEEHLLREEDYTQKTQTLAQQRQEFEAQQEQLRERAALQEAVLEDAAQVRALDGQLKEYEKIDWPAYQLQNPQAAQYHWMQYQQLKGFRDQAANGLQAKMQQAGSLREQHEEAVIQKTIAALQKPDPEYGWPGYSAAHMSRLTEAAKRELGFSDAQLSRIILPDSIKTLNLAIIGKQSLKAAKAQSTQKAPEAQPVRQIPSNRGRTTPSVSGDELSTEKWVEREKARLAKKAANLR